MLGASLLLRMVGDGLTSLAWARWLTPFGLVELTRPYDTGWWLPLVVLAAAALWVAAALVAATGRDVRGGWLALATGRAPRLALLGSVLGFAVRRTLRPLAGWSAGVGVYFLLIGLIAESMAGFLADNPRFADLAGQAGFAGLGSVEGYAATLFALLAIPVGVFTAVRVTAAAAAETDRLLTLLYAGPVTRRGSSGAEVLAAAGGAVVLTLVAGLATWAGTAIVGAGLSLGGALAGSLNVLSVAALCLGAAVFALRSPAARCGMDRCASGCGRLSAAGSRGQRRCSRLGGAAVPVRASGPRARRGARLGGRGGHDGGRGGTVRGGYRCL